MPTEPPRPPKAPRRPFTRRVFGDAIADPYAWMRDRDDPELTAYLRAENDYAAARTAHLAGLSETLYAEIKGRVKETDLSVPVRHGQWWYYTRTVEGQQYPIDARVALTRSLTLPEVSSGAAPDGEEILLDHNLAAQEFDYFSVGASEVSPDGVLVAYAVDTVGEERFDVRVHDIASGAIVDDALRGTGGDLAWSLDGGWLFYTRVDDAWRSFQVWRHRLGTAAAADVLVFEEPDERFWVSVGTSRDERTVAIATCSKVTSEWHLLDAADPAGRWRCVSPRREGVEYDVEIAGGRLVIAHNTDRANFELAEAPLECASSAQWRPLPLTSEDEYLTGVSAFDDFLVLSLRVRGLAAVRVVCRAPGHESGVLGEPGALGESHDIDLGEDLGTLVVGDNPEPSTRSLRLVYSSLVTPTTHYDYDMATRVVTVLKRRVVLGGYAPADYVQRREWARSTDGTMVPMSIVHRRDLVPDGSAGGLLYGYGAYGLSLDPEFWMTLSALPMLDRGYVVAIAHVRGGAELGRQWYDGGRLAAKPNSFSDFIACADHLIATGLVSADRLAASGGSAGGLLIGAVANLAPERFAFLHAAVPFVDPLTTILDESLPLTVSEWDEWGDAPHDETAYRRIKSWSPYENVRATAYPSLLVTADAHDTRVYVTEPAKWVARLREVTAIDEDVNPVIFRIELGASSHAGPSGRYDAWRQLAWETAVLLDRTGGSPSRG